MESGTINVNAAIYIWIILSLCICVESKEDDVDGNMQEALLRLKYSFFKKKKPGQEIFKAPQADTSLIQWNVKGRT